LDSHTAVFAGHMGRDKTEEQVRRQFYWRGMTEDIGNFIKTCQVCQAHKYKQHAKHGLCTPLALATRPFWSISLDLITGLPMTPQKYNAIITVVDRFTKMVVLIPCDSSISGVEVAKLLVEKVFCKFGFAGDLVSDRDFMRSVVPN
jgi:hypothetical protein